MPLSYAVSYDFVNRSAPASMFQLVIEDVVASASAPVTITGVTTGPVITLEQGHWPAMLRLR